MRDSPALLRAINIAAWILRSNEYSARFKKKLRIEQYDGTNGMIKPMFHMSSTDFDQLIAQAIDGIPEKYGKQLKNVFFTSEDLPSPDQRRKLKLAGNQSLYGLYEGIPLTKRAANYNLVLPDKITVFRGPILLSCNTYTEVEKLVKQTVWHEVAHYFSLNHDQIHELEK